MSDTNQCQCSSKCQCDDSCECRVDGVCHCGENGKPCQCEGCGCH